MSWHAGDPDLAACGGRAVAQPATAPNPAFRAETVIPSRLLRFGTHGETWRVLDRRSLPSVNRYPQEDQTVCCFNCAPLGQWPGGLTGIKPAFDFR